MLITSQNLSVIIVSYKSDHVIHKCINSIDPQIEIVVVENSNNINFKNEIENKYKNTRCVLSNENIGMGAGNNLGIKNIENDFALILNPDVILEKDTIKELINASKKIDSFGIISPISNNLKFPNYKLKQDGHDKFDLINPFKVKSVDGYAMLLNLKELKQIKNFYFFDENFFLYLENDDLCQRIQNNKKEIYIIPKAKIDHLGGKAVNPKYEYEVELTRNWHWMWSKFYFNKKHYGYLNATFKILTSLMSAKIKILFYLVTFNRYKRNIYQMRLSGLIHSMLGKKSFYRPKIDS